MYLLIEKGIKGGMCTVGEKRYSKANNPYMPNWDSCNPTSYITYLDANNLYGWAMSQPLPVGNYKWEDPSKFCADFIKSFDFSKDKGFIFCVDLEYPKELHDLHNDYPLAPEKIKPPLCPYMKKLSEELKYKIIRCEKLVNTLNNKTDYILNGALLQLYLSLGLKIIKINKVISFTQSKFLESYVRFNTEKRREAAMKGNKNEKNFFKLMVNAVYGKFLENLKNRSELLLVSNTDKIRKKVNSPQFQTFKIFNENMIGLASRNKYTILNRPTIIGLSILDYSKYRMFDFHYNYIKKKYNTNASLLYTDTDSLVYEIKTADLYKDMKDNPSYFDFSDFPKTNPYYSELNSMIQGIFKEENRGEIITDFVSQKSKMYSYTTIAPKTEKQKISITSKAKGVSKGAQKTINHSNSLECLFYVNSSSGIQKVVNNRIKSDSHQLSSISQNKISLSCLDDKRYYIDRINSRAHGHWRNHINGDNNEL